MERKIQNSQLMQKERRTANNLKLISDLTYESSNGASDKYDEHEQIDVQTRKKKSKQYNFEKQKLNYCSSTDTPRRCMPGTSEDALKAELLRCKKELNDYNDASKILEKKYMKINVELNEMQERHENFLKRRRVEGQNETDCSRKHKGKDGIFPQGSGILLLSAGQSNGGGRVLDAIESLTSTTMHGPNERASAGDHLDSACDRVLSKPSIFDTPEASFDRLPDRHLSKTSKIYESLQETSIVKEKTILAAPTTNLDGMGDGIDGLRHLQKTVLDLHKEQTHFCNVIQQQRSCLRHYRDRLDKMKRIMESQQDEIQKLRQSRTDLQARVDNESLNLRCQLDDKRREVSSLSHKLRDIQARYDQVVKENHALHKRVRALQTQAKEMKAKLDDLGNRKANVMHRLKNAERDLRVLRNYNASLKTDRLKKVEEIHKFRDQLEEQKANSKRALNRQREINDRYCRELQQRVTSLEQKLGRSNNSTSGVLQQREKLIAELQAQITTLVKNFEISQKHIRLLRRQVSNAAAAAGGGSGSGGGATNIVVKSSHRKRT